MTDDADALRRIRELVRPFVLSRPVSPKRKVAFFAIWLVAIVVGTIGARYGQERIDFYFSPDGADLSVWTGLIGPLVLLCIGGVLAFSAAFLMVLPLGWLEKRLTARGRLAAFWAEFGKDIGPIQMEDGVRYRYVDPKALRSHRTGAWPLFGMLLFCAVLFGIAPFFAAKKPGPDALAVLVPLDGCLVLGALASLLLLKKERRDKASVLDVVWTEQDKLFVERNGHVAIFPSKPLQVRKLTKDSRAYGFMVWHEVYGHGQGTYRLDRRYLWPEDRPLPSLKSAERRG
jgi:hypothetical protein